MSRKPRPKFRRYRDSDGSVLRVDVSKVARLETAPNGSHQEWFAMYDAFRGKERIQVSVQTLSVLARERGPR